MKIGIKSGTFFLLHYGHLWCLEQCKKQCDYLIVLLNDDDYVKQKKGVVPISTEHRMKLIKALSPVNEVGSFHGPNEHDWILKFKQERMYKEFEDKPKLIVFHSEEVKSNIFTPGLGVADEIIYIPRISGSTSEIIKNIRQYRKRIGE